MGTSQAEKEKNHDRIIAIAARRVREKGFDGVGVADLMKEVGLTHGGFYRHFGSRDDLIGEAVERALDEGTKRVTSIPRTARKNPFRMIVDGYLSDSHRDSPGNGCAVTALSNDAWRGDRRVRAAYTRQVRLYLDLLSKMIDGKGGRATRRDSVLTLSALVGAIAMARAVDDEALSLEILGSTADALKSLMVRS